MTVLVDTTVWSLALRRRLRSLNPKETALVLEWRRLVEEGSAAIIGPIRQEILSGVRDLAMFERLRIDLAGFDCVDIALDDYDQAARFYNELRPHGIAGSAVDLIICAVARRLNIEIYTTDRDFERYARHLPVRLHEL